MSSPSSQGHTADSQGHYPGRAGRHVIVGGLAALVLVAGCGPSGHNGAPPTSSTVATSAGTSSSTSSATTSTSTTTTTLMTAQASGYITILSPIGLNVRAGPSKKAAIIATAAQGALLRLVARTPADGGWYKVRGATALGWVTANPTYSAPGRFGSYQSPAFTVMFPAGWTSSGTPAKGVHFQSPAAGESVVITSAASLKKLPALAQGGGVAETGTKQVVACGVTALLRTFSAATPGHFLATLSFAIDAHHALGLRANLISLSHLRTVLDFVNSLTFPFPVCVGRPPATTTSTT